MAKYYYADENGKHVYIKDIDFSEGTLEFTTNEELAYEGRNGYYAIPTRDLIRTLFSEDYPQVARVECEQKSWY